MSTFFERFQRSFKNSMTLTGHLEQVRPVENNYSPNFYLPHHCLLKEDGTTTKLSLVFDASAKTTTSFSFNDYLLVGPKLQDDLFNIQVRVRFFKVTLSADIAKMYKADQLSSDLLEIYS